MSLRRATMPVVVRLADVLMTTGREVARLHPGALALTDRLVTYVPPVDTHEFRPDPDRREAARGALGVPKGAPLVGTLGNLNPDKGHEFLVRAAALLRRERPELRLCVLGAHSAAHTAYEAGVRQQARALGLEEGDAIRFMDPGDRASELLPAFDVFVLASRWEGIPTAVLEAMACGVPVVTTGVGAVREVVEDGVSALVVPPRDPAAIADAVSRVLGDPKLARELSAAGPRTMAGRFGLERCVDAHVRAYRMAIAAREEPGAVAVPVGVE
jgi:glycosyltransferase involved in cell wall biosynthesis